MGFFGSELRISGPRLLSLVRGNFDMWPAISGWVWRFWRVEGGFIGDDVASPDVGRFQYEQLLSWILNGEERGVRQEQTPAKKDLETRRDLWSRKGTYIMIWRFFSRKRKWDAIA